MNWKDDLVSRYRNGEASPALAARYGVSVACIAHHLRRLIPPDEYSHLKREHHRAAALAVVPPECAQRMQECVRLYRESPMVTPEIAKKLGISHSAVSDALKRLMPRDEYLRLRHEKRSRQMRGNRHGEGHAKSPAAMAVYRDRWGQKNPNWKGRRARRYTGHSRAARLFPLAGKSCERCAAPAALRHHRDDDPHHNVAENIEYLCRSCHARHHMESRTKA